MANNATGSLGPSGTLADQVSLISTLSLEFESVEWSGKLPVLWIGDVGLCASLRLARLAPRALCGLLFFAARRGCWW